MEIPDRFTLDVTADDIKAGKRFACGHCPIALALHRATGQRWLAGNNDAQLLENSGVRREHDAPEFVLDFDAGLPVAPLTVTFTRIES